MINIWKELATKDPWDVLEQLQAEYREHLALLKMDGKMEETLHLRDLYQAMAFMLTGLGHLDLHRTGVDKNPECSVYRLCVDSAKIAFIVDDEGVIQKSPDQPAPVDNAAVHAYVDEVLRGRTERRSDEEL